MFVEVPCIPWWSKAQLGFHASRRDRVGRMPIQSPMGSMVVPICGSYLGSFQVNPKKELLWSQLNQSLKRAVSRTKVDCGTR